MVEKYYGTWQVVCRKCSVEFMVINTEVYCPTCKVAVKQARNVRKYKAWQTKKEQQHAKEKGK